MTPEKNTCPLIVVQPIFIDSVRMEMDIKLSCVVVE